MLNSTSHAVIVIILKCIDQGEKHYTAVSINKIQELLISWHGIHVGRRWIFYILALLIKRGLVTRKQRFRNNQQGLIRQRSSLWAFTAKGANYLYKKGIDAGRKILKGIKKWKDRLDGRWPQVAVIEKVRQDERYKPNRENFKKMRGRVTKEIS